MLYLPEFAARFVALAEEVEQLKQRLSPEAYRRHETVKLFAGLFRLVREIVPANPDDPHFRLRQDLARFRRARGIGLPPRYRLFWVFSAKHRTIVYLYLNDSTTLRKAGSVAKSGRAPPPRSDTLPLSSTGAGEQTMAIAAKVDLDRFEQQGYLIVEDVLDPKEDLDPVVAEYEALLDQLTERWRDEGKLPSTFRDLPFAERFARVLNEAPKELNLMSFFDIALPFKGVTLETPIHLGPKVFGLLTNPRLLDVVEQFIGGEIYSNPIQHTRIKPPERNVPEHLRGSSLLARTDWHQDKGVHLPEADETDMLTVWLPVTDATEENGCLCAIPGSHREGLVTHCTTSGLGIPEELLGGEPRPLPIRRGGVLFFHHQTKHASLRNVSDGIRWSFDLRYHPIGQPTGRPAFPGFVARSRQNPASAVADWRVWADLWRDARARLAAIEDPGKFNRWTGQEPACA